MTEQPDTERIRAEIEQWGELAMSDWVEPLCDALDAARAERHYAEVERDESREALLGEQAATLDQVSEWQYRGEAAEAEVKSLRESGCVGHSLTYTGAVAEAEKWQRIAEERRQDWFSAEARSKILAARIAAAWEVIKRNRDTKLGDWVDLKEICEALGLNPRSTE